MLFRKQLLIIPVFCAILLLSAFPGGAATFTVINTADFGAGSLRSAIAAANAAGGSDTVVFDIPGPGPHVITVTAFLNSFVEQIEILNDRSGDEPVTVQHNNAGSRIFVNNTGQGLIAGLTISNGNVAGLRDPQSTGAAIRNTGGLTVRNCTFRGNSAKTGGAIWNGGTLSVVNCTFVGNTAERGGAIYSESTLQVRNSTFSGNSASADGGGIFSAIYSPEITNCTFSGNSAVRGGSVHGFSAIRAANTIFQRGATGENIGGNFTSLGNNLSDDAAGGDAGTAPGGELDAPGDIRNTDPRLAALADNGGFTPTHALLTGSPAIDAGNDERAPAADQRNYARIGPSDIGAFESGETPAPGQRQLHAQLPILTTAAPVRCAMLSR